MKRTFTTAAAVLAAGGVGAVGMATPALAAGDSQLPATLPTDNGVANTAFHAAGTLASAQKTVGDVVPLDQQLSGRAGDPVTGALGSTPAGGVLKPVVDALGQATSGQTQGLDPVSAVQEAKPVGETLPASKSGAGDLTGPVTNTVGQLPVAGDLPVAKTGVVDGVLPTSLTGSLENLEPVATPQAKPGQLPSTNVVGETASGIVENAGTNVPLGRSGDPVSGLIGNSPLGGLTGGGALGNVTGNLPVGKSGSPVDEVTGLVSHGPLGGATQLGN
ncbi:hypothetical protein [Saccharopolyspora griseoalba]|uniref:ATP-binding protein n=1 Tax=Saccharopolyspora griseoalba TaxID=1431848 RepID=A0ABW2LHH3_9PSEU